MPPSSAGFRAALVLAGTLAGALPGPAAAQAPLSAIDWLNGNPRQPPADAQGGVTGQDSGQAGSVGTGPDDTGADGLIAAPGLLDRSGDPVTAQAITDPTITDPTITVRTIGDARADATGLVPPARSGLPETLWQHSNAADVTQLLQKMPIDTLPALQALGQKLLLAEATPPENAREGAFLTARLDELERRGAGDAALALVERAGAQTPEIFARWLDLALLTGTEGDACARLVAEPWLSENTAKRVFCMARGGAWQTSETTYQAAAALDLFSPAQSSLLGMFLQPGLIEVEPIPVPPRKMTPLLFRLFEAAGDPLPTAQLPRAYAVADLRGNSGWKAELEAAERLARAGVMSDSRLLGLYTERAPAASGGVWDRVSAVQALDDALQSEGGADLSGALLAYWKVAKSQGLAVSYSSMMAPRLGEYEAGQRLSGAAARAALEIALLSPGYARAAQNAVPGTPESAFLVSVALGQPNLGALAGSVTPLQQAIHDGFDDGPPDTRARALLNDGRVGEALLRAALRLHRAGCEGFTDIADALRVLRAAGQDDIARRAALQLLILGG